MLAFEKDDWHDLRGQGNWIDVDLVIIFIETG